MARAFLILVLLAPALLFPRAPAGEVRGYLSTGPWYPSDAGALNRLLDECFQGLKPLPSAGAVRGLLAPHAGLVHSGAIAARAYINLAGRRDIRRVILLGVAHAGGFNGACVSSFTANSTPLGRIPVDREVTERLGRTPGFRVNNRIMQREHSLENQLPFLQRVLPRGGYRIVPILFGRLSAHQAAGMARIIAPWVDAHTVVVASSDLTHFGRSFNYVPFRKDVAERLHKLDRGLLERVIALDHRGYRDYLERTGMTMCGTVPVGVWMHLFDPRRHELRLMGYATSGDANGDYSLSVGYGAVVVLERRAESKELTAGEGRILLRLARRSLEDAFRKETQTQDPPAGDLTPALRREAGVFVTLKKGGRLRGCIGSIRGTRPLFRGVQANARNAAFHDPRFPPLKAEELDGTTIEVSVMTPLRRIDDYHRIRLGIDGVVLSRGGAGAVYLPQVATETGWDRDTFLSSLCRKAGLSPRAYRLPGTEFRVFQAQIFSEEAE